MDPYRSVQHELGRVLAEVRSRPSFWSRSADDLRFYESGLALVRRDASATLIPWDDVTSVTTIEHGSDEEQYLLGTAGTEAHQITLVRPDVDIARAKLHELTLPRLLAVARRELAVGPVAFGQVVIDAAGLRTEFTELRWERVVDVRVQQLAGFAGLSVVIVGRDNAWIELPVREVSNEHVLVALVPDLRVDEHGPHSPKPETAFAALKRLAEAQQRGPDAVTIAARTYGRKGNNPIDSDR